MTIVAAYTHGGHVCLFGDLLFSDRRDDRSSIELPASGSKGMAGQTYSRMIRKNCAEDRKVFGSSAASYQNTRLALAELQPQVRIGRVFVDNYTELLMQDQLDTAASMAKYWCSDQRIESELHSSRF